MVKMRHIYLLVVDELFADLARVKSVQAAVAFSCPAGVLRLKAVVDEAPLNTWRTEQQHSSDHWVGTDFNQTFLRDLVYSMKV